jgi:SLOG-like protein
MMTTERSIAIKLGQGKSITEHRKALKAIYKGLSEFGELWTFDKAEENALKNLRHLVECYVRQPDAQRPLCIGVFGAPGSGKSRSVKQIRAVLRKRKENKTALEKRHPWISFNLTQVSSPVSLAQQLRNALHGVGRDSIPFIFFDEFDTKLEGAEWSWLPWFLAPMQDGEFEADASTVKCSQAIFVFAGGTAHRAADFGSSNPSRFRAAKGPDFASRLRATLDVRGTEDTVARDVRRALTIGYELGQARKVTGCRRLWLSASVVKELLNVGRYRHGARSVAALVEICCLTAVSQSGDPENERVKVDDTHLPSAVLSSLHVDRGPLDPRLVGGLIGLSGGGRQNRKRNTLWKAIAEMVLHQGACIAHGGDWRDDGLTYKLIDTATDLPCRFAETQVDPYVEVFATSPPKKLGRHQDRVAVTGCSRTVDAEWPDSIEDSVSATHMRRLMNARCVARVFMFGSVRGYQGRMPGIFEEAVWSLATGQPIYVVGGYGGAADALGRALGLAKDTEVVEVGPGKSNPSNADLLTAEEIFRPDGNGTLPLTWRDVLDWLVRHAVGGSGWPDNGLSVMENQRLFAENEPSEIVDLIRKGLLSVFDH